MRHSDPPGGDEAPVNEPRYDASARDPATGLLESASLVCAAISLAVVAYYWILRGGGENALPPSGRAVGVGWFLLCAPPVLAGLLRRHVPALAGRWWTCDGSLTLLAVGSLVLLGRSAGQGSDLGWLPATAGASCALLLAASWARRTSRSGLASAVLAAAALSSWLTAICFSRGYRHAWVREGLLLGEGHRDLFAHSAVMAMIQTYGVPSSGIHAATPWPYHCGSHWLFAQLGPLLDLPPLEFYTLAFPVIFLPWLVRAVASLACTLAQPGPQLSGRPALFWFLLFVGFAGVLPAGAKIGPTHSSFGSESMAVAVASSLYGLSILITLWRRSSAPGFTPSARVALVLLCPALLGVIGFTKSSIMLLLGPLAGYAAFRLGALRRPPVFIALALGVATSAGVLSIALPPGQIQSLVPAHYLRTFVDPAWWVVFPFTHYLWVWLLVWLLALQRGSFREVAGALRRRELFALEAVLFVAFLGALPGLLLPIGGGSAFYFSDYQRWLALPIVIAGACFGPAPVRPLPGWARLVLVSCCVHVSLNAGVTAWREHAQNLSRAWSHASFASVRTRSPEVARVRDIVQRLEELSKLPRSIRAEACLFIPRHVTDYWATFAGNGSWRESFVAPALSHVTLLEGWPLAASRTDPEWWFPGHAWPEEPESSARPPDVELLSRARALGFSRVLVLESDARGARVRTLFDREP